MGICVAALQHERNAADHRQERDHGDDEDLATLALAMEGRAGAGPVHGDLVGRSKAGSTVHGCFGQAAAPMASVGSAGQLFSTDRTEVALNVTPFLKMRLPMIGVIGL